MLRVFRRFGKTLSSFQSNPNYVLRKSAQLPTHHLLSILPQIYEVKTEADDHYHYYINTLATRFGTMQAPELLTATQHLSKAQKRDWRLVQGLANAIAIRAKDMELEQLMQVANMFALIDTPEKSDKALFAAIEDVLQEQDTIGNINYIETFLWAFSQKNYGTTSLYDHLSTILYRHGFFNDIPLPKLSRIAYYLARTTKTRNYGGFGLWKKLEERIFSAIHQGKLTGTRDLIEIVCNVIGNNIGSNKLHALLELKMFKEFRQPHIQVSWGRLTRLTRAFTYYRFKLPALDLLVRQLVIDGLAVFTNKELVQILWAYTRTHKADEEFYRRLISHIDFESTNLRGLMLTLNSWLNAGFGFDLFEKLETRVANNLQDAPDHYIVRTGLLYAEVMPDSPLLDQVSVELGLPKRFTSEQTKDLTRALVLVAESHLKKDLQLVEDLWDKVKKAAYRMDSSDLSICLYTIARGNLADSKLVKHLLDRLIATDPTDPIPLAGGVWGAAQLGVMDNSIIPLILSWIGQADVSDFSIPVLYSPEAENDVMESFTATTLVQMAWTLLVHDYTDPRLWQGKLLDRLQRIQVREKDSHSVNQYVVTAKAGLGDESFFSTVDSYFGQFLRQILIALKQPVEHLPAPSYASHDLIPESPLTQLDQTRHEIEYELSEAEYIGRSDQPLMFHKVAIRLLQQQGYNVTVVRK